MLIRDVLPICLALVAIMVALAHHGVFALALKLALFTILVAAYITLHIWAEARDARDWLAHWRKGMEPATGGAEWPAS